MTSVSTPNTGALPRQRTSRLGSMGAIVLVIAVGAAIAGGIAVTSDEAPAANFAGQTFTQLREGQATSASVNNADWVYLNQAREQAPGNTADRVYLNQAAERAPGNTADRVYLNQAAERAAD